MEGYDGMAYELLKVLAEKLLFNYEVVVPDDNTFGILNEDGSWSGVIGCLQRDEADIGMRLAPYPERAAVVDFSFPYVISPLTFVIQKVSEAPKFFIYLSPFKPFVWLGLIFVFLFCSFAVVLIHRCENRRRVNSLKYLDEALSAAMIISGSQGAKNMTNKAKIAIIIFKLMLIILRSCYAGLLLSFLMSPIMEHQISNVNELAEASRRDEVKVLALDNSNVEYLLSKVNEEPFKSLGRYARKNPGNLFKTVVDGFLRLKEGFALLEEKDVLNLAMAEHPGGVFISHDSIHPYSFTIGFRKNFTHKEDFDNIIIRIVQAGIYKKITDDYFYYNTLQDRQSQITKHEIIRPISLSDLFGVFLILASGKIVSTLILLVEVYFGRKLKLQRKRHREIQRHNILEQLTQK